MKNSYSAWSKFLLLVSLLVASRLSADYQKQATRSIPSASHLKSALKLAGKQARIPYN